MDPKWSEFPRFRREPDFENLRAVLDCRAPSRPTLFEFYMNDPVLYRIAGVAAGQVLTPEDIMRVWIRGFQNAGYDYVTITTWMLEGCCFPVERKKTASISMNMEGPIHDRGSFDAYPWQAPDKGHFERLADIEADLPNGMKCMVSGPDGILECVTNLLGFESLCMLLQDDPPLVSDVFESVGSRILAFYREALKNDAVGGLIANDDWGFKTQTLLPPAILEQHVFPWYREVCRLAHAAGKVVVLHSCGNLEAILNMIIDDMKFDGKHSYEDAIWPVEDAYEALHQRIGVIGGIDVDFMCRQPPEAVYARCVAMLDRSGERGGYALGSGNSIPRFMPAESYAALLHAAHDLDV